MLRRAAVLCVLAALAGIFLTSFPAPGVAPPVALSAFLAIPAWVLGGFDSVPGAVLDTASPPRMPAVCVRR